VFKVVRYQQKHRDAVVALCWAEGWESFPADADRAHRSLTAPGVTSVVAIDDGKLIGFAQLFSDGELQSYLANLVVAVPQRRMGVGKSLINEALRRAGGERIDLLSEDESVDFYKALPHRQKRGFRLYPPFSQP